MVYVCEFCEKTCVSSRGLSQHIGRTPYCKEKQAEKLGSGGSSNRKSDSSNVNSRAEAPDPSPQPAVLRPRKRRKGSLADDSASTSGYMEVPGNAFDDNSTESEEEGMFESAQLTESDVDHLRSSDEDTEAETQDAESPPNVEMLEAFREYCEYGVRQIQPLDEYTVTSVKLLEQLRQCRAPMCAYPRMLEWHLKETGHLRDDSMTLKDTKKYFSRATLLKKLAKRYNCEALTPKLKQRFDGGNMGIRGLSTH